MTMGGLFMLVHGAAQNFGNGVFVAGGIEYCAAFGHPDDCCDHNPAPVGLTFNRVL